MSFHRLHPAAQHSSDLIDHLLQRSTPFQIQCLCITNKPQQDSQHVQFHAYLFERGKFTVFRELAGKQDAFDQFQDERFRSLPDRMAIRLRHDIPQSVEDFVEVVDLSENGDFKFFHSSR